jgi:hypothetical protein
MTIELLYFTDCPNYEPALAGIREALQQEKMLTDISKVEVTDQAMAEAVGFLGSPTVRVNGVDVEPSARIATSVGMCCRTYTTTGTRRGAPAVDTIRKALREPGNTAAKQNAEAFKKIVRDSGYTCK